jgi:protein disulfide-isomerase
MMSRRAALILVVAAALGACGRGAAPAGDIADAAAGADAQATSTNVAHVEGIDWFEGGVDAAFEHAARENRLVFLYWGAEWCPPCYDLKAHVFPRHDFQQALRQFVAVYLDGDAPGAQRVAEQFDVLGYPSVVVLKPDRTELARISGGSDLASYAEVLALALENSQPVAELLSDVGAQATGRLGAADCRRLAWNDWSDWSREDGELVAALRLAAERCPPESSIERDRLLVMAADRAAASQWEAISGGAAPQGPLLDLVMGIDELLADPVRRLGAGTALLYIGDEFFQVVRHTRNAARTARVQENYFAFLDALESDPRQSGTVRLLSAAKRLQAVKALQATQEVPAAIAARSRATLDEFLARDYDVNARAGIVNSASWVLYELGDDARLRTLLEGQMKLSRTPYYYMPDMADIEERAGNTSAALVWLERGYRESKGPATRFQWGTQYLLGLLRMSPGDETRIRAATLEVIGELDGPDRIHARTRTRLGRLDPALDEWARQTGNAAALASIGRRWREICTRLPESDPQKSGCPDLLG